MFDHDIICAPATAFGGALAIVRVSGRGSIECCNAIFRGRKPLTEVATHTLHYGSIVDADRVVDDVVVSVFRAPNSYTGEDSVEISLHGSRYIASEVLALMCRNGARMAEAGEFSARAFASGRIDLSQAEAVADLIASSSKASHTIASTQMRGGYSDELRALRANLLDILSLLELELDFSEEDVEFADRAKLREMVATTLSIVGKLMASFRTGQAIREGVRVAIVGEPNVGKSTLLNRLVEEDRAMVSEVAGTTRDTVEEEIVIDGIMFRFIDTAGLRTTADRLENMGIERTRRAVASASVVLHLVEPTAVAVEPIIAPDTENQTEIVVVNKIDTSAERNLTDAVYISARDNVGIDELRRRLCATLDLEAAYRGDAIVSNARHYDSLCRASESLNRASEALSAGLSGDLVGEDIRHCISALGEITGEITSAEVLSSIFSRFCIGK